MQHTRERNGNKNFTFSIKSDEFEFEITFAIMKFSLILLTVGLFGASLVFAADDAKISDSPEQVSQFIRGSEDMIAAVYRRAISQAVDTKVKELQQAIKSGDNVVPVAIDILKLTLLSNPTQLTIRKTAEHIINIMSPEAKKLLSAVIPTLSEPEEIPTEKAAADAEVTAENTAEAKPINNKLAGKYISKKNSI